MCAYHCVLIAVDLSTAAGALIDKVKSIVDTDTTGVHLVHVLEPVVTDTGYDMLPALPVEFEAQMQERAQGFLADLISTHALAQAQAYVDIGTIKGQILHRAQEIGADLIVVGTHGRHGMALLLGSTANALLHGTPCDVLAVRIHPETEG